MPPGFGGSPHLSILVGRARGEMEREEREREQAREAILNRLREMQVQQSEAAMRRGAAQEERREEEHRMTREQREAMRRTLEQRIRARNPEWDDERVSQAALAELGGVEGEEEAGRDSRISELEEQAALARLRGTNLQNREREQSLEHQEQVRAIQSDGRVMDHISRGDISTARELARGNGYDMSAFDEVASERAPRQEEPDQREMRSRGAVDARREVQRHTTENGMNTLMAIRRAKTQFLGLRDNPRVAATYIAAGLEALEELEEQLREGMMPHEFNRMREQADAAGNGGSGSTPAASRPLR